MKHIYLLAVLLIDMSYSSAQWVQTKGPYIGRTTAMITVGNNIYACNRDWGNSDGRIYRSSNFGMDWTGADNGITPQFASVSQFAHIENVQLEVFDIHEVLISLINLYSTNQDLRIQWNKVERAVHIHADRSQVNRLFTNLIQNAIEASAGSEIIEIVVTEGRKIHKKADIILQKVTS